MANVKRLLKLAELLEKDARRPKGAKFDLSVWGQASNGRKADNHFTKGKLKKLDCGTTACAVGLACLSGAFKREGLGWNTDWLNSGIEPSYRGLTGWGAVNDFFGLDEDQSSFLFLPDPYSINKLPTKGARGELAVAKRIRQFVAAQDLIKQKKLYDGGR